MFAKKSKKVSDDFKFFLNIYTKNVLRALKIKGFKLLIKKYQIVQMYKYKYNINKKIAKISPGLIMI